MTYSELLEIVLDARYCEGLKTTHNLCTNCKVFEERQKKPQYKLTCDGIDAVYTAKLRAIMKKLDEMNLEVGTL